MPELLSHTIAIGLAIAVVISLAGILNIVREQTQSSTAQIMAENICNQIKLTAENLNPTSQSSVARLELPKKIGNEAYSIRANNHTITVTSENANHNCIAGTTAQLAGTATGTLKLTLSENIISMANV